jgi:intein-encoded DNA endonuclease-like protein
MTLATERAKQVHVSEAQFRLDLAEVFAKDLKELGLNSDISESSESAERKEVASKKKPLFLAANRQEK